MADNIITDIIDTYLQKLVDSDINSLPGKIEPEMRPSGHDDQKEWQKWIPIPSRVIDEEITEFEGRIGHKLPSDYIRFLKHKHFYELAIAEATFCSHPVNTWRASLTEMVYNGYPREFLIDKGYIPFANWSDWGYLCFDTNRNFLSADYPIVLWDHETADQVDDFSSDFKTLLKKLDKADKESWEES